MNSKYTAIIIAVLTGLGFAVDIGDYNRMGKNARFFDKGPRRPDIAAYEKQTTSNRKPDRAGALSVPPSPKETEQSAIDFASFLKQHDMVWDRVPNRWEVAPYTGNGNVGFLNNRQRMIRCLKS